MSDAGDLHERAMETADQADAAKRAHHVDEAKALFRQACALESEAAESLMDKYEAEPTRSVLFRSAASLAIEAGQSAHAAYLVARGLEGTPPEEIREELRDLLETLRRTAGPHALADEGLAPSDRFQRYLSSCRELWNAADDIRRELGRVRGRKGRKLAGFLATGLLASTEESLRVFTGDASLCVDLFGSHGEARGRRPVSSESRLPMGWREPARDLADCAFHMLWEQRPNGRQIRESDLPSELLNAARESGIRSVVASAVRIESEQAAYILLALASLHAAFADELALEIMSNAAFLLEIALQAGRRDEILVPSPKESDWDR